MKSEGGRIMLPDRNMPVANISVVDWSKEKIQVALRIAREMGYENQYLEQGTFEMRYPLIQIRYNTGEDLNLYWERVNTEVPLEDQ